VLVCALTAVVQSHLIKLIDRVSTFKKKVLLWKRKINKGGEMTYFPRLQLFITENKIEFTVNIGGRATLPICTDRQVWLRKVNIICMIF
jgi:hypothetical protein